VSPYSRTTGSFYGILKVLDGSSLNVEGSLVELMGGSSKFPWAVETGELKVEMSIKISQFEDFLFELFLGKAPTTNAPEATGSVTALVSKVTGVLNASTGIASVSLKSGQSASVKFAKYVVKYASATTVDVFASSDVDAARGTDFAYQDDLLKITATPLSITTGTAVEIPGTGLELTGGSGTIALVAGGVATFESRPINTGSTSVRIGGLANQTTPEFGAIVIAQKRSNDEMTEIDCFRCLGSGMPIGFEKNAWANAEIKVKAFYDSAKDGVFDLRYVKAST
jgi:hypothetical protein